MRIKVPTIVFAGLLMVPSLMEASPISWEQTLKIVIVSPGGAVTYSDFDHMGPDLQEKLQRAAAQGLFRFTSDTGTNFILWNLHVRETLPDGPLVEQPLIGKDRQPPITTPVTEPEASSALMIASIGLGLLAMAKRRLSS